VDVVVSEGNGHGIIIAFVGFLILGFGYIQPRILPELAYMPIFGTQLSTVLGLIILAIGILLFARSIIKNK